MKNDPTKPSRCKQAEPEGAADGYATHAKKASALSDFDLRQIDDARLEQLDSVALLELAKRLLHTAKLAKDRLNQTASNSSRPPSSMPPWAARNANDVDASSAQGAPTAGAKEGKVENQATPDTRPASSARLPQNKPESKKK